MLMGVTLLFVLGQEVSDGAGSPESFSIWLRGNAVWTFAWGTASARNSFVRFERGEDLDLRDDFGLLQGGVLADIDLGVTFARRHRIILHSLYGSLSANTVLPRTFEYNDGVFLENEHAETKLEIDLRDLDYAYRIVDGQPFALWAGAGARWSHWNVGIRSSTRDPAGSMEENTAIFPTLNVGVGYGLAPSLSASLEIRASPAALPILFAHASLGRFVDARLALEWTIASFIKVEAGGMVLWMWQRWRGRESDGHYAVNYVEIVLVGPSVGFTISF